MTARAKVVIDQQTCAATGYCRRVSPQLFELTGPGGTAVATSVVDSDERRSQADEAEIACPTGAIWLEPLDDGVDA